MKHDILIFCLGAFANIVLLLIGFAVYSMTRQAQEIQFTIVTKSLSITANSISMELRKSQFVDGKITGHITPKTSGGTEEPIETGTCDYASSNENVAKVVENPDDEKKFDIEWVGAGEVDITSSCDAKVGDGVRTITGSIHLTLLEDEADTLVMELDNVPDPE